MISAGDFRNGVTIEFEGNISVRGNAVTLKDAAKQKTRKKTKQ